MISKRDELLIRAGVALAELEETGLIFTHHSSDKDRGLSEKFIVESVADYIMSKSSDDFEKFIKEALIEEFGIQEYDDI